MGKDKSECSSYRPISIQSSDCRLYASIITTRLENLLPDIIDDDQTGFIKNRQTQDDVRRVLHLMEHLSKTKDKSVVLNLDTEKVFDSVGWNIYIYHCKDLSLTAQ